MHDIATRHDYDVAESEVVRLRLYLADLIRAEKLMGVATEAMQQVDDTIEGPDFEAAIISVRLAIQSRQAALDDFDGRFEWDSRGLAQRVYDAMGTA